jgi:hypothetical protein
MLVGCVAGLLHDTWFQVGAFGLSGFKRTLLGWALGATASRLDLNQAAGRIFAGAAAAVADGLLDFMLKSLLDQTPELRDPSELLVRAASTGLLAALAGRILDHVGLRAADRER